MAYKKQLKAYNKVGLYFVDKIEFLSIFRKYKKEIFTQDNIISGQARSNKSGCLNLVQFTNKKGIYLQAPEYVIENLRRIYTRIVTPRILPINTVIITSQAVFITLFTFFTSSSTSTNITIANSLQLISLLPIRIPKTKKSFHYLYKTIPQNWTRSFPIYILKIQKASAILFIKKRFLFKAYADTFAANIIKKERFLE